MHGSEYLKIYSENNTKYDFSVNLNPLGMPEKITQNFRHVFEKIHSYPDLEYKKVKQFFKSKYSIEYQNILPVNGISEGLDRLMCFLSPRNSCYTVPGYIDYRKVCSLYSENAHTMEFEDILSEETPDLSEFDVFITASPNNPCGRILKPENIFKIARDNPDTFIIIDHSFCDFIPDQNNNILNSPEMLNLPNLIILYSFTKFYCIPGLRLGCVIGQEDLISKLDYSINDWNVNSISAEIPYYLDDYEYEKKTRMYVKDERERFFSFFSKFQDKADIFCSESNFLLIKIKNGKQYEFFDYMLKNNIVIRKCDDYESLGNEFFRFCISVKSKNKYFMRILDEFFSK